MPNGHDEREEAEEALRRVTPDQGGNTFWDYEGVARDDPRVQADEAQGGRAARDQGGSTQFDYEEMGK